MLMSNNDAKIQLRGLAPEAVDHRAKLDCFRTRADDDYHAYHDSAFILHRCMDQSSSCTSAAIHSALSWLRANDLAVGTALYAWLG